MTVEFKDVSKIYRDRKKVVHALKDVYLTIPEGKIFGLIGYSGAGKSTLLRTINLLETPSSGQVIINGVDVTKFKKHELRQHRLKVGMIFQQFNLIKSKTVAENIAFSLNANDVPKKEQDAKIDELLERVNLIDKKHSYPKELSGGQKQRVGIARALANDPEILLCDEATSALDPETTKNILNLLKEINKELNITIVIITHEMDVIKEICDEVAVMANGEIVEQGSIYDIFSNPQSQLTQHFVNDIYHFELPEHYKEKKSDREIISIKFLGESVEKAFVSELYRSTSCEISIIQGRIEYIKDKALGMLSLEVTGPKEARNKVHDYIDQYSDIEKVIL